METYALSLTVSETTVIIHVDMMIPTLDGMANKFVWKVLNLYLSVSLRVPLEFLTQLTLDYAETA